jgi:hypothetical protein
MVIAYGSRRAPTIPAVARPEPEPVTCRFCGRLVTGRECDECGAPRELSDGSADGRGAKPSG